MAVMRDRPYTQFNFLVDLGTGDAEGPDGGFAEVTGLESSVEVIEYRTGNSRDNAPIKLTGLTKAPDVTLKRGVIGSLTLYQWFDEIRHGNQSASRTVTIVLLDEAREAVMRFRLVGARIVKYRGPALDAEGNDVAVEEIVLAHERLEID